MSRIFVLGAGVVGLTSAYALARKGHAVTVVDAGAAPAEAGASFGNGAQLSYSYTDALACPSLVRNLPTYLLGLDPAFRLRPTVSPGFWRWALRFLANASARRFETNTIEVLKLALESRKGFGEIAASLSFDHRQAGKLTLYASQKSMDGARSLSRLKNAFGVEQEMLTPAQAMEKEPALAAYGHPFVGALWSPFDEAGDSYRFCLELRRLLEVDYGVTFQFDTTIHRLRTHKGRLTAIETDRGEWASACAVLSLGAWSPNIAATAGIRLPVWPMQGYSMTVPATTRAPAASITDSARKIVFCRIGEQLRIAGLAEIGARFGQFDQARFDRFAETARRIFPEAGDYTADPHAWTGFRPMSPNSQPIVGSSEIQGLFLNCGHGSLGWTLSMGTAARLASLI